MSLRLALAQYPVSAPRRWQDHARALRRACEAAAARGAELLVFPEYAAMSLAHLLPPAERDSLAGQLSGLQRFLPDYFGLHADLARQLGVSLVAGSVPVASGGRYVNRAAVFGPSGVQGHQDKWIMTRFEREHWGVSAGHALQVFELPGLRFGIALCYDIEFPLIGRALVNAGAELLLAPSCTDTLAGYHRVRLGARARALENQCYAAQAPLVGSAPWSLAVDVNLGRAAVFTPVDRGFPDNGVLTQGRLNRPGWVHATLDRDRLAAVRADGQVLNHRHWDEQPGGDVPVGRLALV